jgi:mRNA-degrading endonuclease RelE of RelBE toxin-antitoxin system
MKKVVTTPEVDIALRTLGQEERCQVLAWLGHLANLDGDPFLQEHSYPLDGLPGVFVLHTGSDIRIFFSISTNTITVLDVAKKQAIMTTAGPPGNR